MSDGYNKPQYHAVRDGSSHCPAIGDVFDWNGTSLVCVKGDGCAGCFFNEDFRKTPDHREEMATGCITHFCETDTRQDCSSVKFIKEN